MLADKYRLERVLGEGATGQVWLASQIELARDVAVKLMHATQASRPDARLRFLREARVTASLHHPGAVQIIDFGDSAECMYLVMELLSGESLRARLDRGPLPLAQAVDAASQIADVLDAAHQINLVHRDIKPENTFVVGSPTSLPLLIKVVDFGLAFITDAGSSPSLGRLTADGVLGGTPAYMSPEQARGRSVGPPSDIYSLGCTLYEMISGRPPFLGSITETIMRHAYSAPVPLRELDLKPAPPAALDDLLHGMLGKSPPLRPTAARVIAALAKLSAASDSAGLPLRLRPRAVRALAPTVPLATAVDVPEEPIALVLGVEGALDEETRLALTAARIEVTAIDDRQATALFAPGATLDRLTTLAARGLPLFTDVEATDFAGIAARVRVGCRAAVARPVSPASLIARLRRVTRVRATDAALSPTPATPHP